MSNEITDDVVKTLESRGHIEFDTLTEQEFIDLVRETLEQSEFIETKWTDSTERGLPGMDDVLVIQEVFEDA